MKVTLWGTRGSLAAPGPMTARYGGNTSCVAVEGNDGSILVLDAGTGMRQLGLALPRALRRVDILLTHLHMDHIQGLGFFLPISASGVEVHIYGPAHTPNDLHTQLARYLSPPLFPVSLHDLECTLHLHAVSNDEFRVGDLTISSAFVCHPNPTVGYRIMTDGAALAYLPDHEPALGAQNFPSRREWISGSTLAAGVDLLIHDAQYSHEEYPEHLGWGHSSLRHTFAFAALSEVKQLVPFHHDPAHTDDDLDRMMDAAMRELNPRFVVTPGQEGAAFELS